MKRARENSLGVLLAILVCLATPIFSMGADKLIVRDEGGATTFKVEDDGSVASAGRLLSNGASVWGSAPFVLGQNLLNRGIVITDKAASNQKNIYFGWNVGSSHDYAEIFALQEGVAYKNLVLNPNGGCVGIGAVSPAYPLQMGSGAYVSAGGVWTNASSREYKQDIRQLTGDEAMNALKGLRPVKFSYKAKTDETHVGFIAEEVPDLVATKDRKGMSSMDVVAVLTRVVQEQQKVVQEQKATIAELSRRLAVVEEGIRPE
ncbi:MAG: tail fiber domain-containing protein [Deltaproteobacteria bacterium]|nr:tail fiber domain-containing protein [Deltaproteobacteria bacterium]